ncbi:MBL fold metallo-hydrolase [Brevibacillus sp. SYP-B805]|uniref:MBL fold metallo-hydrolase n=1 Tax=Brevibacillus sp. SYP-B805 TaxID=1578199 RepID=UPI0013ED9AC0|nr:MBL fold metallo-hydrolase [Brevibacillus sp. SYP-B805]NGQ97268.1 MBL fold metallo-hydrolase [Brevibacillus sp. SYP-B805]
MNTSDHQQAGSVQEAAPGVYLIEIPTPFAVGPVNVYLIAGEALTLVDAGPLTPEAWEALKRGIEWTGHRMEEIEQVVLTHHHVDHCGLLAKVRAVSGAQVYAHPLAVPYVEQDEAFMQFHDRFFYELYRECGVPEEKLMIIRKYHQKVLTFAEPCRIDGHLKHEQTVPRLSDWQVLYTPGHSQSHLSLYRAKDRVLIAGDHIIKRISSNAFIEPPRDQSHTRPLTLVQYRTALEMCAAKEIDLVLAGHGEPVTNHRELITQRLQRNWERTNTLRSFLREGEKTAYELTTLLFPQIFEKELPLTLSETLGHIDLLMILHQLETRRRDGAIYYSL